MDGTGFDRIARLFADRRLSRRRAVAQGGAALAGAGIAAIDGYPARGRTAAAQEATPAAIEGGEKTEFLYVQSFRHGSIAPKAGADGTYTLTLEQGLGQTIYFSDRPERTVGAGPTAEFIEGLGFQPDNPPNAALVLSRDAETTDIAVVELFNPAYDPANSTATYDVKNLKAYEEAMGISFAELPTDLAALPAAFGTAHLFIDDCADGTVTCTSNNTDYPCPGADAVCGSFGPMGYCYDWSSPGCWPCEPYDHLNPTAPKVYSYWIDKCNRTFASCNQDGRQGYGCYVSF
jgi:hypothetical protein